MYGSLCEPWSVIWCGELTGVDPAVTGTAVQAASDVLWQATGRRFGNCPVTVRPCRQECLQFAPDESLSLYGGGHAQWPHPALIGGEWINLACGVCSGPCSCMTASEVLLPEPVWSIAQVVVDGVVLPTGSYAVYDDRRLVRTDGTDWPLCQDWKVKTGVGAWSITARFGADVPALGRQAVGVLAAELARLCAGVECGLPLLTVTQVQRQGVTFSTFDPQLILQRGLTGLYLPDLFIRTYNPSGIRDRARAWSPDYVVPRTQ